MTAEPVAAEPIPFTVIGGFLGSGKTTLVNRLLREARGRRITVLVNDFGSVSIDADLIERRDGDTITLANGCICCSLGGELAAAVPSILDADPRPDHVVVEASGVSEPRKVAQYGTLPGFRLDGVVVLADAEAVTAQLADARIGHQVRAQLVDADVIVLTKVDLVEVDDADRLRLRLAEVAPAARVITAPAGTVAPELILDVGAVDVRPARAGAADTPAHGHGGDFVTATLGAREPLDRAALQRFLDRLPPEVIRVKGIVQLEDDAERATVVQRVGTRTRLTTAGPWPDGDDLSRLVLIATAGGPHDLAALSAADLPLTAVDSGDALRLQDRPAEHHL